MPRYKYRKPTDAFLYYKSRWAEISTMLKQCKVYYIFNIHVQQTNQIISVSQVKWLCVHYQACLLNKNISTAMILSFRADMSGQTVETQIRLLPEECGIPFASFWQNTLRFVLFVWILGWLPQFSGVPKLRNFTVILINSKNTIILFCLMSHLWH